MSAPGIATSLVATAGALSRAEEIVSLASSVSLRSRVLAVLSLIESDTYLEETKGAMSDSITRNEPYWDLCCALAACAELLQPRNYLEIGVRRGRSAAIVAAFYPAVSLHLFDMWHPDYAGVPNPGPDFVRDQLARAGHRGSARFVDGRSQQTIPAYFNSPDSPKSFNLMTVDGDHRDAGALADLENVFPRLAIGGTLLFDDIRHPGYPTLYDTWRHFVDAHLGLIVRENSRDATGTALALHAE